MTGAVTPANIILRGDCIALMGGMAAGSVDCILTDPPYLVSYRSRDGRGVPNDDNAAWLAPAFAQMHRVLKPGSFCVSFYGWHSADLFISAWRAAGLRIAGHIVFRKRYASSVRYLRHQHEQAYVLTKGAAVLPASPMSDVIDWRYTGNRWHPTQKPVASLMPIIEAFCPPGGVVFDPFCGSGSTLVAARMTGRGYIGMEIDPGYHAAAARRLAEFNAHRPARVSPDR
jgi:site-specific DNA-methyltransferase (adenine-specific)